MGRDALPIYQLALRAAKPKGSQYPVSPITLGEHLKKRRIDIGLFQREVAVRIGSDESSVWLWENGRRKPELKWMPAILTFLGYDPRPKPLTVGQQLCWYREGRGWSQKRLAKELHVDQTTVARWERGEREPGGALSERVKALLSGTPTADIM